MDVKSTFLNGELNQEVYIEKPKRFILSEHGDYVCILKKDCMALIKLLELGTQDWIGTYSGRDWKGEMKMVVST